MRTRENRDGGGGRRRDRRGRARVCMYAPGD